MVNWGRHHIKAVGDLTVHELAWLWQDQRVVVSNGLSTSCLCSTSGVKLATSASKIHLKLNHQRLLAQSLLPNESSLPATCSIPFSFLFFFLKFFMGPQWT